MTASAPVSKAAVIYRCPSDSLPESGCDKPAIMRDNVVFPEPLSPTRQTYSPLQSDAVQQLQRHAVPHMLPCRAQQRGSSQISHERQSAILLTMRYRFIAWKVDHMCTHLYVEGADTFYRISAI